jgi:hypothetical protein
MDLISIIVTYYNKIEFIKDTLESISSQSYKNFEVLIIYSCKAIMVTSLLFLIVLVGIIAHESQIADYEINQCRNSR